MRTMLKMTLPVEAGNKVIADGALGRVLQETMERLKPEAAYFTVEDGKRTAFIFFDFTEVSQMPPVAEPLFGLGADVQLTPVMSAQDLQKGLASLPPARR